MNKLITIKDFQIKRVNVESSIKVVIEEVAWSISVGPSMSRKLELGLVSAWTILHAISEPEELVEPVLRSPRRHVRWVAVADIDNSSISVDFPAIRDKIIVSTDEWAVAGVGAGDVGYAAVARERVGIVSTTAQSRRRSKGFMVVTNSEHWASQYCKWEKKANSSKGNRKGLDCREEDTTAVLSAHFFFFFFNPLPKW